MDNMKAYLLSIIAVALISSIITSIVKSKHTKLIKTLCGVFIAVTVFSPVIHLNVLDYQGYYLDLEKDARDTVEEGKRKAAKETESIIKAQTEAYILNKAAAIGADVYVTVTVSETEPQQPVFVEISGDISPYLKTRLGEIIAADIGVPKEAQFWS